MDAKEVRQGIVDFSGMVSGKDLAQALGVSTGRVSQIVREVKEELGIPPEVSILPQSSEQVELYKRISDKQDNLELKLMEAFEEKMPMFMLQAKPVEMLKCVQIVNSLKRRANPVEMLNGNLTVNQGDIVMLNLPAPRKPKMTLDERTGAVIEVSGRTMVSASKISLLETVMAPGEENDRISNLIDTEKIHAAGRFQVSTI